jgi:hypothetical protein
LDPVQEVEIAVRGLARINTRQPPQKGIIEQIQKALDRDIELRYAAVAPISGATQVGKQFLVGEQSLDAYLQGALNYEARTLGASALDLVGSLAPTLGVGVSVQTVFLPVSRNLPQRFGAAQVHKGRPEELGQWILKERVEKEAGFDRYEKLISGILAHVKGVIVSPGQGDFQLGLKENELPGMTPAFGWSSGTSHLAMFLGALASIGKGSVLLAEEPELSLHPGALRQLMDEIRRLADEKQVQFFLTTHSDVVVEQLEPETKNHTLWRFSRNEDGSASSSRCETEKDVDEAITSLRQR